MESMGEMMNTRDTQGLLKSVMPDVQGSADARQLPIQRVGVKSVRYPIRWRTSAPVAPGAVPAPGNQPGSHAAEQPAVATFNMYVSLPAEQKGTHMSRFIGMLEEVSTTREAPLDTVAVKELHAQMLRKLEADSGRIEMAFTLFVRKTAPVSGVQSLLDYEINVTVDGSAQDAQLTLTVLAPVKSLCPCSKEISDYGAHNQRSHVTMSVKSHVPIEPEDLIRIAEQEASSEIYGLLKRVDEKYITERAYDNPKFVEDLVRDVAGRLKADPRIESFTAEAENFESIHNHSAYARIDS